MNWPVAWMGWGESIALCHSRSQWWRCWWHCNVWAFVFNSNANNAICVPVSQRIDCVGDHSQYQEVKHEHDHRSDVLLRCMRTNTSPSFMPLLGRRIHGGIRMFLVWASDVRIDAGHWLPICCLIGYTSSCLGIYNHIHWIWVCWFNRLWLLRSCCFYIYTYTGHQFDLPSTPSNWNSIYRSLPHRWLGENSSLL